MYPTTTTYKADGNVISTNADIHWIELSKSLDKLRGKDLLEIDLRAARMIDSVGLNVIVKTIKIASDKDSKVRLRIGSESLKRICTFTRLDQKAEIVGP